jgi:hypothetical protein
MGTVYPGVSTVMPGLLPGIHVFLIGCRKEGVDGRGKPARDE